MATFFENLPQTNYNMRLENIQTVKQALNRVTQTFSTEDISRQLVDQFTLRVREPFKRKFMRLLSPVALNLQQRRFHRLFAAELPISYNWLCLEDRFGADASLASLQRLARGETWRRVLVPGCYLAGEDVQHWLRKKIQRLDGIDVYSLQERWREIVPQLERAFGTTVHFQQATIEQMPFEDGVFDLVATQAVLEHVRNLRAMVDETSRVLRNGGWAWHSFGPLYFTFGGDHCMSAFGENAGYDHLLLNERDYQQRIFDQAFFNQQTDPNLPFWARQNQFSFATAAEYLDHFARRFEIKHLVVKFSERALTYRARHPEKWEQLRKAGIAESDLLIKSLVVVLRKK